MFSCCCKGNIQFVDIENPDGAKIQSPGMVSTIAGLLAVDPKELEKALCFRVIASRGEVVEKMHSAEQAYYGRNAFAKVSQWLYWVTASLMAGKHGTVYVHVLFQSC